MIVATLASLALAFAAGIVVGRDTLARANRRLRRQRDELIEAQARQFRDSEPVRLVHVLADCVHQQSELLSRKAER